MEFSVLADENEEDVVNDWQEMKMKIDIAFDLGMPFSDESKDHGGDPRVVGQCGAGVVLWGLFLCAKGLLRKCSTRVWGRCVRMVIGNWGGDGRIARVGGERIGGPGNLSGLSRGGNLGGECEVGVFSAVKFLLLWLDLESYSDSDYAGANLDRKSTTGGCQFLGRRLITWQCKKQTIVATSTTEAEYVAAASCCGQVLWIQNQMLDYGFNFMNTKIYIDNESTICIVKNPVYHSKTKHIAIRHHFIRDAYEKKLIQVLKIHTNDNVADLLTKAFDVSRFQFLIVAIGMVNP
ncbi:hypothetical protein Tco_0867068 [Tanacetum coccineum]